MNLANCRHSSKLRFPVYSFSLSTLLQTSAANRHAVTTVLATQLHATLPISQFGQSQLGQCEGSEAALWSLTLYSSMSTSSGPISLSFARATFMMLMDLFHVIRKDKKSEQWPQPHPGGRSLPWNPRHSPFIIAEVFVCKLLKEGPFHHLLWSVVLQEVDEHVLQPGIVLGGWGLFGKQVQPGVLLMECLPTEHMY